MMNLHSPQSRAMKTKFKFQNSDINPSSLPFLCVQIDVKRLSMSKQLKHLFQNSSILG
jgi:hypothetical protein